MNSAPFSEKEKDGRWTLFTLCPFGIAKRHQPLWN